MDLKVEKEVGDDSEWPQGNPAPGGVAPEALGAAAGRDDAAGKPGRPVNGKQTGDGTAEKIPGRA